MDNHYHLIIETPDGNLSKGMRQLNGVYTQRFNKKHNRVGHIFQGRYKAILIQKESYLLEVCRYVILNPVRVGAVRYPEEWKWSSCDSTMGKGTPQSFLTTDWILGQFGKSRKQAEKKYKEFVMDGIGREKIWEKAKRQSLLGEEDFIEKLIKYVKGKEDIKEIPRNQRYIGRPHLNDLFKDKILEKKQLRDKKLIEAVEKHGYSQKEIADYLCMHYSTISRLVNKK